VAHPIGRLRAAVGIGPTWAVVWGAAAAAIVLGVVLETGSRPDPPFPLMFTVAGFVAGVLFSCLLCLIDGRRPFSQLSGSRVTAWGASTGLLLATVFVLAVTLAGDDAFPRYLLTLGPAAAAVGGVSAAGSLALARRTQRWRRLFVQLGADDPDTH
jgi:hypothetical protein